MDMEKAIPAPLDASPMLGPYGRGLTGRLIPCGSRWTTTLRSQPRQRPETSLGTVTGSILSSTCPNPPQEPHPSPGLVTSTPKYEAF